MKPTQPIKLSIEQAAREFGVSRESLRRGLKAIGVATTRGAEHSLATLFRALSGNASAHRAELLKWRAHREKQAALREEGSLIPRDVSIQTCECWAQPIREAWQSLPHRVAALVNPGDPNHARAILQARVDEDMRLLSTPETPTL